MAYEYRTTALECGVTLHADVLGGPCCGATTVKDPAFLAIPGRTAGVNVTGVAGGESFQEPGVRGAAERSRLGEARLPVSDGFASAFRAFAICSWLSPATLRRRLAPRSAEGLSGEGGPISFVKPGEDGRHDESGSVGAGRGAYAASDGDVDGLRTLLAEGAAPGAADAQGWTPLHSAAQAQVAAAVEVLLAAGVAVDVVDRHGNTLLWKAVFCSQGEGGTVRLLLEAGAASDRDNVHGESARALAGQIANL